MLLNLLRFPFVLTLLLLLLLLLLLWLLLTPLLAWLVSNEGFDVDVKLFGMRNAAEGIPEAHFECLILTGDCGLQGIALHLAFGWVGPSAHNRHRERAVPQALPE